MQERHLATWVATSWDHPSWWIWFAAMVLASSSPLPYHPRCWLAVWPPSRWTLDWCCLGTQHFQFTAHFWLHKRAFDPFLMTNHHRCACFVGEKVHLSLRNIRFVVVVAVNCMGESTSVFIRRYVKLKCAYGDLCILTISRIKRIKINIFVSISFCNLVRSIHLTTCRSMFSEANACTRVAGSGENCCELAGSQLYTSEKSRADRKKCRVCQRAMSFPLPLTRMWKTNGTGSGFRRWTRSEYCFDTDVESLMSRGLQLKNYKLSTKKPVKRRKELGSEVDIRSFFKKPRINWYP